MAVQDVTGLLRLLDKSGLLSTEEFDKVKAEADSNSEKFDRPEKLARYWVQTGLLTKWQVLQLMSGKTAFFLGKYKLLNLLGIGGMGRVFLAEHIMMNRKVALKVISKEYCKDPEAIKRFQAEARAIAALNHPNIVQAYNFESEGERYYIVMEYVNGQSLEKIVKADGPLPIDDVVSYLRQSAKALKHAHDRKMIHCDIKPDNLLLNDKGQIKILDMGIAHLQDSKNTKKEVKKEDSSLMGTVDYMAPEMAAGNVEVTPGIDIYSLGCTMFFLLTGEIPYPDATLMERILSHQEKPPRDPRDLRPATPKELANIILKMEAKKPEDRYQSMDEILTDLNNWSPESTELNILDNASAIPAVGSGSGGGSGSGSKKGVWSSTVPREETDTASKQTESFDFLPSSQSVDLGLSSTVSNSGSNVSSSRSSANNSSTAVKGQGTRQTKGKRKPMSKKSSSSQSAPMSGQTKIIYGGIAVGVVLLVILLVIFLSMGQSTNSKPETDSTQTSEEETKASQTRAAEILKKEQEEAAKQPEGPGFGDPIQVPDK